MSKTPMTEELTPETKAKAGDALAAARAAKAAASKQHGELGAGPAPETPAPTARAAFIEQPIIGTRALAQQSVNQQAMEGLIELDDADDADISGILPPEFPTHITHNGELREIKPYFADYFDPNSGDIIFGAHKLRRYLTPLTYSYCQTKSELKDIPRSAFLPSGEYIQATQVLCICLMDTWNKICRDNPGTVELMRRRLEAESVKTKSEEMEGTDFKSRKRDSSKGEGGSYNEGEIINTLTIGQTRLTEKEALNSFLAAQRSKK